MYGVVGDVGLELLLVIVCFIDLLLDDRLYAWLRLLVWFGLLSDYFFSSDTTIKFAFCCYLRTLHWKILRSDNTIVERKLLLRLIFFLLFALSFRTSQWLVALLFTQTNVLLSWIRLFVCKWLTEFDWPSCLWCAPVCRPVYFVVIEMAVIR